MSATVHFLDVGQAHAAVAIDAESAVIVDCPLGGVVEASELLHRVRPSKLDVVVTHRDLDHCGGISALVRDFGNSNTTLFMNPVAPPSPSRERQPRVESVLLGILDALDRSGATPRFALAGNNENTGTITWSVLAPPYRLVLGTALIGGSINRTSVVVKLQLEGCSVLIPGDIDDVAAAELLSSGQDLSADVLLLPHHGARMARIRDLLRAVDPDYVVVSAGSGPNHPHIETLRAAASSGSRLLCTQVTSHCHANPPTPPHCAGSITFGTNGGLVHVRPSRSEHHVRIAALDSPVCVRYGTNRTQTD